jgi:Tol biopolymer transport system component
VAAVRPGGAVYFMNLDGSGLKTLTGTNDFSVFPQWSPDGKRITIYEGNPYGEVKLSAVSLDGTRTPLVTGTSTQLAGLAWARPDMNGLLYFSGPRTGTNAMTIWRVNADGSGLVALGAPANSYDFTHPAPSPDGKTVLYDADQQGIMSIDVAAQAVHALGLQGFFPVYAPDGAHITYVSGSTLMIANSDGTNARSLWDSSGTDQLMAPSWSADGKWILAAKPGAGAVLVRVSDSLVLPLPYTSTFNQLALH